MAHEMPEGRFLTMAAVRNMAPHGLQVHGNQRIYVAREYADSHSARLIHEYLHDLGNLEGETDDPIAIAHNKRAVQLNQENGLTPIKPENHAWWTRRERIPGEMLHTTYQVHTEHKVTGEPDISVKTVDPTIFMDTQIITRTAKILQYLQVNGRPTVKFIGYITNLPGKGEKPKKEELVYPHRGKIFLRWAKNSVALNDKAMVSKYHSPQVRHDVLAQLADHFAFFHGSHEEKAEKEKDQRKRDKPRWYISVRDCKLENFLYQHRGNGKGQVIVLDPETWEITAKPPIRKAKDYDLNNLMLDAYKASLVRDHGDVRHFVSRYLGLHLDDRKHDAHYAERLQDLTDSIWKYVREE